MDLAVALGWRSLCVAALWLTIGLIVSWGRRRGLASLVALFAAFPTVVYAIRLHPGMSFERVALTEFEMLWHTALVPLAASLIGGLIAEAVSPSWRTRRDNDVTIRQAHEAASKARREAIAIGRELAVMKGQPDPAALARLETSLSFVERRIVDASRVSRLTRP